MRRKAGVPPIVTVLVTIASIVAASLVAWFMWTSTRSATRTPILEATAAYVSCSSASSCTVSVTVRNIGATDVRVSSPDMRVAGSRPSGGCTCTPSCTSPVTVPPGGTIAISCTFDGTNIPDGAEGYVIVANQTLGFKVIRP
ncbi:MAG: hypothetical protein QXJ59_12145 [Thermofilaceae archaeon]